jgi:hypothetical protein
MYFCPNCSYILDINKSTNITISDQQKSIISKPNDIFKLLETNVNFLDFKADFTKDELIKNKKFQKLKDEDKNKLNILFEENIILGAEFKCDNCNYTNQITETTLLYQITIDNKFEKINTLADNELITKDSLLPHTRDYICKNPSCITHNNNDIKNSVFYKEKNSFKVNYICCVCYYNW